MGRPRSSIGGNRPHHAQRVEVKRMLLGFDHVAIAVSDLARASADYEAAGFTVTPRGYRPDIAVENAMIFLPRGGGLELIAFKAGEQPQRWIWWLSHLARGEGLMLYVLETRDSDAEAASLRRRGFAVDGPIGSVRVPPHGVRNESRSIRLDAYKD